jgi:hypothetical protein
LVTHRDDMNRPSGFRREIKKQWSTRKNNCL